MADAADFATDLITENMERALAARPVFVGVSLPECQECVAPIPVARQQSIPGVRLCIECQRIAEFRQRQQGVSA